MYKVEIAIPSPVSSLRTSVHFGSLANTGGSSMCFEVQATVFPAKLPLGGLLD